MIVHYSDSVLLQTKINKKITMNKLTHTQFNKFEPIANQNINLSWYSILRKIHDVNSWIKSIMFHMHVVDILTATLFFISATDEANSEKCSSGQ